MIHDFATAPRTPRVPVTVAQPVQPKKRRGRVPAWVVPPLAVVLVSSFIAYRLSAAEPELVQPVGTVEARQEYLEAAEQDQVLLKGPEVVEAAPQEVAPSVEDGKRSAFEQALASREMSADGYGFYETLQDSDWEVPVQKGVYLTAEDRKRASYVYILQAASVRSSAEAASLVAKLKRRGLQASYSVSGAYPDTWYRVNVGPFRNVSVMNKAEDVLVSMRMMPLKRRVN